MKNIEQQLSELMNKWKNSLLESEQEKFSADGIVDLEQWNKTDTKILVLLKETNDYTKPINELIYNVVHKKRDKGQFWQAMTFHTVGKWLYGLYNLDENSYPLLKTAKKHRKNALLACAYMNLKKVSGKSATNYKTLEKAAHRDQDFIREEIKIIDPQIIICGGTAKLVKSYIFPEMQKVAPYIYKYHNIIIIDSYHPAYRRVKGQVLYDRVVKNYHNYLYKT